MKTKRAAVLSFLVAMFLIAGCGDDDGGTGPGLTGEGAPAQAMIDGVLVPSIEAVNLATYIGFMNGPAVMPGVTACEPLDFCDEGSAEICTDSTGVTFNFYNCLSFNTTIDGSVTFQGSSTVGTAVLNITLEGNLLSGTISYSTDGTCFNQTFAGVTATVGEYTAVVYGDLEYCSPPQMINGVVVPSSGGMTFFMPSIERAVELWFYDSGTPGSYSLNVTSQDFFTVYLFCTGFLYGGIECEAPDGG